MLRTGSGLDLLIINPGDRAQVYQSLGKELAAIEPPVWAGLIATYIRQKGFSVELLDANALELSPEETARQVTERKPLLTAIVVYGHQPSASTQTMPSCGAVGRAIKKLDPSRTTILVGGHVAALPERTLAEETCDFVAGGEGPVTVGELLQALASGRPEDLAKVRGLYYRVNGGAASNPPAPLIQDLNGQMPQMAWDLLPMDRYRAHNWHCFDGLQRQPYASIYTTLGCPYHCTFCLAKGTTIITAQGGNKRIEDIQVGDRVMAWNEKTGKLSESTVVATGSRWVDALLRIRMSTGETIEVTGEHPIYTPRGWVEAGQLQAGQPILVMEKGDKFAYVRTVHNPARRPEVRAKLSALRRLNNPVACPEVRAKISATLKAQGAVLSKRLKRLHALGRIPYRPMSEARRQEQSERMKCHNPMRHPGARRRATEALKARIASGQVIPYLKTAQGRLAIAAIARQRALTQNPMKDPAVALAQGLRQRRSEIMHAVWKDEARADGLMKSREGKYVAGAKHWAWAGGVSQDPYPPAFGAYLRRKIRKRDGDTCQHCGRRDSLSVHHIDYRKENCDPCNLITLCVSCNSKANANRRHWETYYQEKMAQVGNCPRFVVIASIEEVQGTFQVFNFECSPHDNYFAERLLVHNCCIQAPFKAGEKLQGLKEAVNSYRYFHPERVVDQLEFLVKRYGVRNVKFADEMFVLNPSHVLAICEGIIARGLTLNIWAYARVDTIRDAAGLEKLKRAGVNWLAFGIEAANERVRDGVKKGFEQGQIFKALDKVRQAGIHVIGNYIFGLPDDDHETMQETLQMALDLNCEFANFYAAMAYPGSALYRQALEEGWPLPESWSGYSQHAFDTLPLPTKHLSAAEVLAFRDQAFNVYFNSPKYLQGLGEKFGAETVRHVQAMAKVRLSRKIVSEPHTLGVVG